MKANINVAVALAAVLISIVILVEPASSKYLCIRNDNRGISQELILERKEAKTCELISSCKCEYIKVTCLIGPDSLGNFQREQVPLSYAESCDRESCICSNHANFVIIAEQRIAGAKTFD